MSYRKYMTINERELRLDIYNKPLVVIYHLIHSYTFTQYIIILNGLLYIPNIFG